MAWHSRFLLGSIFSILAPPVLLVYLARHLLHLPRILSIILFVVAIPIHGVVSSIISGRRAARQRALLGAYPIPKIRGSLPGNIDVLWKLVQLEPKEYSGDTLRRWANEHGPTYDMNILWGHQIVTTDPTNFKEILSTNFNSFEKGTKLHDMLETFLGDGIFTTDGEIWKHHRALARPFFEHERTSDLNLYEKHADALIKVLHDCYEASEPIEVQGLVARFSMDTITEFLFGASLSTLDQSSTHEEYESFIRAFNTLQHVSMKRIRIGSMWPLFELFGDKTKAATEVVNRFVQPIIQGALDRKGNVMISREEGSLLDYLVQETEDMKAIRDSLVSFLLAGRDTTASLLTFSLYALTLYPKVLHEVRREILETIGAAAAPNANQLKGLKYLKAFLNETLRLFPPVPMNIRRAGKHTTEQGTALEQRIAKA